MTLDEMVHKAVLLDDYAKKLAAVPLDQTLEDEDEGDAEAELKEIEGLPSDLDLDAPFESRLPWGSAIGLNPAQRISARKRIVRAAWLGYNHRGSIHYTQRGRAGRSPRAVARRAGATQTSPTARPTRRTSCGTPRTTTTSRDFVNGAVVARGLHRHDGPPRRADLSARRSWATASSTAAPTGCPTTSPSTSATAASSATARRAVRTSSAGTTAASCRSVGICGSGRVGFCRKEATCISVSAH